jgi:hypothetical protein
MNDKDRVMPIKAERKSNLGRPNVYNEKTKPLSLSVPESRHQEIKTLVINYLKKYRVR